MRRTEVGYADYSCNPIRARRVDAPRTPEEAERFEGRVSPGWACVRVSAGCRNCYAAAMNRRLGTGLDYTVPNLARVETYLDERVIQDMLRFRPKGPYKNGRERPVVFMCDMTDLFGEWVTDAMRDRVFAAAALRPDVDWLMLTKRPEGALEYLTSEPEDAIGEAMESLTGRPVSGDAPDDSYDQLDDLPLPNVGIGVSVEDQAAMEQRVGVLASIPAAWRWLSCEPLLGPLDLGRWMEYGGVSPVDWVVVGGESGPGHRPMEVAWLEDVAWQCRKADVPVFVKQDSGPRPGEQGRIPAELWARKEVWR